MARLILIALFIGAVIALVVMLRSLWISTVAQGGNALRSSQEGIMAPTTLQKVSYAALIVVLLGTASGVVGGM